MIYKVLHPNGVDVLVGKPGGSLQIQGDVSVRWVEVSGDECTVALGSEPSMILLDEEEVVWIFGETRWEDLYSDGYISRRSLSNLVYQRS